MPSRLNNGGIVGPLLQEVESGIWSVDSNIVSGPAYNVAINGSTFNEGDDIVITVSATNLFENSTIRFTINGIDSTDIQGVSGGTITSTIPYSGTIDVISSGGTGSGQLTLTLSEDLTAEGTEIYSIIFDKVDSLEYPSGLEYTQFNVTVIDTSVTKTIGFDADEAIYDVANSSFVYADENGFTIDEGKQYKILFFARNLSGAINWSLTPVSNTDIDIASGTSTTPTLETIGFDDYYRHEVTFNTNDDFLVEGNEEYTFIIRYQPDITIESSLSFTLSDTSRPEIYLTNSPATSILEGQVLTIELNSIHTQLSYVVREATIDYGPGSTEFETSNNVISGLPEGSSLKGAEIFTTPGTFDWEVPQGVTSISAVAVGGGGGGSASTTSSNGISGGGGGGGALHYNTFAVTPGETLTIVVGSGGTGGSAAGQNNATSGTESSIKRGASYILRAGGGTSGLYNSTFGSAPGGESYWTTLGGGGGNGGSGGAGASGFAGGGGGGAGGYSGNGGNGSPGSSATGTSGTGGGGAGGSQVNGFAQAVTFGGGGVGIFGEGASGTYDSTLNRQANSGSTPGNTQTQLYGGGGNGAEDDSPSAGGNGAQGAVRILIGGDEYPTSNTEVLEGYIFSDSNRIEYNVSIQAKYDAIAESPTEYTIYFKDGEHSPENINSNTAIFSYNFTLNNLPIYQLDEPSSNTVSVDENTVTRISIKTVDGVETPKWRIVEGVTAEIIDAGNVSTTLSTNIAYDFSSVTQTTSNSAIDIFPGNTAIKECSVDLYSTESFVSKGFSNIVRTIKIQPDGKVLVGGDFGTFNNNIRNTLVRLNADGTEDTAFYTNLGTGFSFPVLDTVIQSDGKIIVGGSFSTFNGNNRRSIVKLNADGTEDTTFYANLGTGFNNDVFTLAVQPDGKILVGGVFTAFNGNTRGYLVRLNADGTDDTAFYTNLGSGFSSLLRGITLQSDGKILVGGDFTSFNGNTRNRLVRLNSDGTEDTDFSTNLGTGFGSGVYATPVQSDGKILVGGSFTSFNGNTRGRLLRLNSDGSEDANFYTNMGTAFTSIVRSIDLQSDGKILVGGSFTSFNGNTRRNLVKLNTDGTEDTAFYGNLNNSFNNAIYAVKVMPSDELLVGGSFTSILGLTVIRFVSLNSDGTLSDFFPLDTTLKVEIFLPTENILLDTITFNINESVPVVDHTVYNARWEQHNTVGVTLVNRLSADTRVAYGMVESQLDNTISDLNTEGAIDLVTIDGGAFLSGSTGYDGIFRYTIPRDGVYDLKCRGGRGGGPTFGSSGTIETRGSAAITSGRKVFRRGDVIYGIAGAAGGMVRGSANTELFYAIAGGGGMSAWFYYPNNNIPELLVQPIPLMVAGGGGGWNQEASGATADQSVTASQASVTVDGKAGVGNGSGSSGGTNGSHGLGTFSSSSTIGGGRGGAGWNTSGGGGGAGTLDYLYGKTSYINNFGSGGTILYLLGQPFIGGTRTEFTSATTLGSTQNNSWICAGGWGGGGGATAQSTTFNGVTNYPIVRGAGGGGGYSGGGGANSGSGISGSAHAGGGGSYVSNELFNTSIQVDNGNATNGYGQTFYFPNGYIYINFVE